MTGEELVVLGKACIRLKVEVRLAMDMGCMSL
jgi:hypothetical protein